MVKEISLQSLSGATLGNYRLHQLVWQSSLEAVFLTHSGPADALYLVHILAGPSNFLSTAPIPYLERFQRQASRVAKLQHPYILPIFDYGYQQGLSYLVSPYIPMRPLRDRLTKNRVMDVFTIGRYLDQIAAALEYAHQHGVLHGNLTLDCIFVRPNGHLVVADFGVMRMLELSWQDPRRVLLQRIETCAPEQLLGRPSSIYTDVYALGALLYELLTGSPVFTGNTYDEIIQQHLYASVPLLSKWRAGLPAGLYSIIARALAKNPTQRFHQPGALANAYHQIVAPNNKVRMPFVITPALPGRIDQSLASSVSQPEAHLIEQVPGASRLEVVDRAASQQPSSLETPLPPPAAPGARGQSSPPGPLAWMRSQRGYARLAVPIALLILLLVASGTIASTFFLNNHQAAPGPTGQITFFDSRNGPPGHTDAFNLVVRGLSAPPAGYQYDAWLINDQSEQIVKLGALLAQGQTFSLNQAGESKGGQAESNLLALGDKLEITLEQGQPFLPEGKAVLIGTFPPLAFSHIGHLLVSFPDSPRKIGVLVGLRDQTQLLSIQADVLQSAAASRKTDVIQCATQSIIDIIEGLGSPHYRPLTQTCAHNNITATGDGFGLLGKGYIVAVGDHAHLAAIQPDATANIRLHARLVAIAASTIERWVTTVDDDALALLQHPTDLTKVPEIVMLAGYAYHGNDVNGNGQVDPVAGEAGAVTAYLQGQMMATLPLVPAA